jgi:hypothetical protein
MLKFNKIQVLTFSFRTTMHIIGSIKFHPPPPGERQAQKELTAADMAKKLAKLKDGDKDADGESEEDEDSFDEEGEISEESGFGDEDYLKEFDEDKDDFGEDEGGEENMYE